MMFRSLLLAVLLTLPGALRANPPPAAAEIGPKLIIYLARGPANSCGPGCDHWIAIEGKVDHDAASRIRSFLHRVKDTQRPIYLHSPGGEVDQALTIGRLLRARKAVARIGRTIVTACSAAGTQVGDACLKIKAAGGEVEAEIATVHSMCNSACAYLFLGATTREVAPDAAMGVHNSKFSFIVHGHPSERQIAAFRELGIVRAERERAAFIAAMGISRELDDLIRTVKFENLHILTRPELYRFGIDRRAIAETAWTVEPAVRPYIHKLVLARKDDGASFRTIEWRLFCENKDRARLMLIREFDKDAAGRSTVVLMAGPEKPVDFGPFPARVGAFEAWSGTIATSAMKAVLAAAHLQIAEGTLLPDGSAKQATFEIDTNGLEPGWTQLLASCSGAPAPMSAKPFVGWPPPASAAVQ